MLNTPLRIGTANPRDVIDDTDKIIAECCSSETAAAIVERCNENTDLRQLLSAIAWACGRQISISDVAFHAVGGPCAPAIEVYEDSDNRCTIIRLSKAQG